MKDGEDLTNLYRLWSVYFILSCLLMIPSFFIFGIIGIFWPITYTAVGVTVSIKRPRYIPFVVLGLAAAFCLFSGQGWHPVSFALTGILGFLLCLATASYFVYVFFTRIRATPMDGWRALWHIGLLLYALHWVAVPVLLLWPR